MRKSILAMLTAGFTAVASGALAADATLSLRTTADYDSNIFRSSNDADPDFIVRVTPYVRLVEVDGGLTYRLGYRPSYEHALQTSRIKGFRHAVDGNLVYRMGERTELAISERFQRSESINYREEFTVDTLGDQGEVIDSSQVVGSRRRPTTTNRASIGLTHQLTPRLSGRATATHRLFQSRLRSRADNQTPGLVLSGNYALSARTSVGIGVASRLQIFENSRDGTRPRFKTLFVNPFLSWSWLADESTRIEIQGGPTFVESIESKRGNRKDTVTGFGEAALTRRWSRQITSRFSYQRQDTTASGTGGSSVVDAVTLLNAWQISRFWSAELRGDWSQFKSVVPVLTVSGGTLVEVDNSVDTERYGASLRMRRRLGKRLSAGAEYRYSKQTSKGSSFSADTDFDLHIAGVWVQYDFDQWNLW